MSVYFCLVVVALLVPVAYSAICVAPDQFEGTFELYYHKEIYYNVSNSISRQVTALTEFTLYKNKKRRLYHQKIFDYSVKVEFDIPHIDTEYAQCYLKTLRKVYMVTEIPDNAVRVDTFPIPLPDDLPKGIEYWRFKWSDNNDVILGILRSPPNICTTVVWGPFDKKKELILEKVAYIRGNYSLRIRNMDVFEVPSICLSETYKLT